MNRKVVVIALLAAVGGYFLLKKPSGTNPAASLPANENFASQFENSHIVMQDNTYSIIVHNGKIYYDDTPGFFQQYVDTYGVKQSVTYPNWGDFYNKMTNNGTIAEGGPLSTLFA